MDKAEVVRRYLEYQDSGQVEPLIALLTDDAELVYPMGTSTGKAAIEAALRGRPGAIKPEYGDIDAGNDHATVVGRLPPGMAISSVALSFDFAGDLITRIEITMS